MSQNKEHEIALRQALPAGEGMRSAAANVPYVSPANAGDHVLIHRLLLATQQSPTWERFSTWFEDPYYAPSDRILLRRGNQIIGHVHVTHRTVHWGGERIVSAGLHDLVVLPEYDEPAGAGELLAAAEDRLREEGVVLAMMRSPRPEFFQRMGWVPFPREGFTRAGAHDILAHVTAQPQAERRERKFRVRTWRHIEGEELAAIYADVASEMFGPVWRNERYWHWLVGRKDHDFILLAEATRPNSSRGGPGRYVGYAVARQDRLIELLVLPGYEQAAVSLLARVCREMVERGFHTLSLFLPVEHPLHEVLLTAGGQWCTADSRFPGRLICKIFQLDRYVERMFGVLHRRAREMELDLPCRFVLDIDGRSMVLVVTRRSARLERDGPIPPDAPHIACSMDEFQRLLVGRLDARPDSGGLLPCSDGAEKLPSAGLFSPLNVWQPLWDAPCW